MRDTKWDRKPHQGCRRIWAPSAEFREGQGHVSKPWVPKSPVRRIHKQWVSTYPAHDPHRVFLSHSRSWSLLAIYPSPSSQEDCNYKAALMPPTKTTDGHYSLGYIRTKLKTKQWDLFLKKLLGQMTQGIRNELWVVLWSIMNLTTTRKWTIRGSLGWSRVMGSSEVSACIRVRDSDGRTPH